ncbi:MAG: DUF2938 domain-containing protein [Gammaproteobacteria bacterium]|nr:DUF2938 domain-containing protein [Gammaproteobacteria bacterium]
MNIENSHIFYAVLVGIGATVIMDLWALGARRVLNVPSPNYCLVGRWLSHMPGGRFMHTSIVAAAKKNAECAIGWGFHYVIGVVYVFLLVVPTSGRWLEQPTLTPALLVGIGTVLIPYFIMQPSFGLGIAAARTANPAQARVRSLMSHTAYGVGLYLAAILVNRLV